MAPLIFIIVLSVLDVMRININIKNDFYSTPYRGRVYKWKFCLSICPSSLQILFLFLIQTLHNGVESVLGIKESYSIGKKS